MIAHRLTSVSLVGAQAQPDLVRITWHAESGANVTATVYRRTSNLGWDVLGLVTADGTGQFVLEDRQVSPGVTYGYRLGLTTAAGERFFGEVQVAVPRAFRLALAGLRPNPAITDGSVEFTLPDGEPARLELMDLAGRRLEALEVDSLGAGDHRLDLARDRALAPGVYLLRLTHAGRSLTSRAVFLR